MPSKSKHQNIQIIFIMVKEDTTLSSFWVLNKLKIKVHYLCKSHTYINNLNENLLTILNWKSYKNDFIIFFEIDNFYQKRKKENW